MTAAQTPNAEFASPESQTIATYRPFSRLAIASFLLGLLSATALIQPLLWVVPVVTVVLALVARRSIARSGDEQRGRGLAAAAMALALLFVSWAIAWDLSSYVVLARQARRHGEAWFEIVRQGRLHEAHQLTMLRAERLPATQPLEDVYQERNWAKEMAAIERNLESSKAALYSLAQLNVGYQEFIAAMPMSKLVAQGKDLRVRFERTLSRTALNADETEITQLYTVVSTQDGQPRIGQVQLVMVRTCEGRHAFWRVAHVEPPSRGS